MMVADIVLLKVYARGFFPMSKQLDGGFHEGYFIIQVTPDQKLQPTNFTSEIDVLIHQRTSREVPLFCSDYVTNQSRTAWIVYKLTTNSL